MRIPLQVVGGTYRDPNRHWSSQRTINCLPIPAERAGTETQFSFRDVPGMKPFVQIGHYAPPEPEA